MTFTLLSSHYVVCSFSVLSFYLYCIVFVFSTFVVNKLHIYLVQTHCYVGLPFYVAQRNNTVH